MRDEARKRRRLNEESDNDFAEEQGELIQTDDVVGDSRPALKKRERKAAAKKIAVPKIKEPVVLRDDVRIPL